MIHLDDLDDDPIDADEQARADQLRAMLWCLVLGLCLGLLIWVSWAGV